MQCIAIANHKGGVGKTALSLNIGALLAHDHDRRVLLIDIDPQGSLTQSVGAANEQANLTHVMGGGTDGTMPLGAIVTQLSDRLYIAPSDITLASAELSMIGRMGRENILKRALLPLRSSYDVVLIDCPPSLVILTVNALNAADGVLIPSQPLGTDLRGLNLFIGTLNQIRNGLNPKLKTMGIVPTMYDSRFIHHNDAIDAMNNAGLDVLTPIGRSVKVAEAMTAGEALHQYEPANKQVDAFKTLTKQVDTWLRKNQN